ncbi:GMC oxidoreductase [Gautieria morchelliformis]|nr:GMC oxidoreductase [Gautieria morchelliformis]
MSNSVTDVANRSFDYVIAGAGTAGLTLAARLSEDPSVSVVVLEAGPANLDDPNILMLAQYGKTLGNPNYDWFFPTVKQPHANDKVVYWSRGKGLGGSSGLNFACWVSTPPAADMDAIEMLGNPGWGWESFSKYVRRSETFNEPTEEQVSKYHFTFDKNGRGSAGPIQTAFMDSFHTHDAPFHQTLRNMGIKALNDPYKGDTTGTWAVNATFDPKTYSRSYAATAYYQPNVDRPNLTVLTGATVARVLFADCYSPKDSLTAMGVEFLSGSDTPHAYVVHARKEVIVATGAIKTPQLLELSGIGRRDVLDRIGIDVKLDLPGVGENVQEHHFAGVSFELKDNISHESLDMLRNPEFAAQQRKLHAEHKGMHGKGITAFSYFPLSAANPKEAPSLIAQAAKFIEEQKASGKLPAGLADQYDLQLAALRDDALPDLEIAVMPSLFTTASAPQPGKFYTSTVLILGHPLSRGTIHAVSKDPMQHPEINPHAFECDFDLEMLVQHMKFAKSMVKVEPWKSVVASEVDPGPQCTTDEGMREYIKNTHGPVWHAVGSCSMLPLEKQGVVDPQLKVYGTQNLRIADLSILPLHIAAHTQSAAYVIGEKAADLIRGAQ